MYKFLPIYVMCLAIYGTNNHERTMEILYKLENKLHNRNCCKFARTGMQQVGQSELVYFWMKNMHYELENQYDIGISRDMWPVEVKNPADTQLWFGSQKCLDRCFLCWFTQNLRCMNFTRIIVYSNMCDKELLNQQLIVHKRQIETSNFLFESPCNAVNCQTEV